jgi:hypothetical protein
MAFESLPNDIGEELPTSLAGMEGRAFQNPFKLDRYGGSLGLIKRQIDAVFCGATEAYNFHNREYNRRKTDRRMGQFP